MVKEIISHMIRVMMINFLHSNMGKKLAPFIILVGSFFLISLVLLSVKEGNKEESSNNVNLSKCPNCGTSISPEDKFCGMCGYKINTDGSMILRDKKETIIAVVIAVISIFLFFGLLYYYLF
jgi:predicted nucleic acid-binding Zn ribbon protein